MSEQQGVDQEQPDQQQDQPTTEGRPDQEQATETPGREAAKYRRQLRETEARATALAGRVETMQKREVERLVATDLATPADVWLTDTTMADLVDDDGEIDPAKVGEAVTAILTERPSWRRAAVASFDGGARTSAATGVNFQQLLQGRKR